MSRMFIFISGMFILAGCAGNYQDIPMSGKEETLSHNDVEVSIFSKMISIETITHNYYNKDEK